MADKKRSRTVETLEETPTPEDIGEVTKITPPEIKSTKGTECTHPLNPSGYHQKSGDGTCRYCGQ